ncbi:MAG TPA: CHASE3 domain-containing protein [Jatrophihabitans sp.]
MAWATIGLLVGLLLATAIATFMARKLNQDAQTKLERRWSSAQVAVGQLTAAYVDQESGQRGFLLTGDEAYLRPYRVGAARTAQLQTRLRELLAPDPTSVRTLATVNAAGDSWRTAAAEPAITARARGPLTSTQLRAYLPAGEQRFDLLRSRLEALGALTVNLVHDELGVISVRQTATTVIAAVALGLSVLLAAISIPLVRRMLLRPLDWLVHQLQVVAGGAEDRVIAPVGPTELQTIASAAEQMRRGLVDRARELVTTHSKLTLRDERNRIAADLHQHTIQQVSALGLSLGSVSSTRPDLAELLYPLIDRVDRIIRELRDVIFAIRTRESEPPLSDQLQQLLDDATRTLGFHPRSSISTDIDNLDADLGAELSAALGEALSNVAQHARATEVFVSVTVADDLIRLEVADNGVGFAPNRRVGDGLTALRARAHRLGGSATISATPGAGATLTWDAPTSSSTQA